QTHFAPTDEDPRGFLVFGDVVGKGAGAALLTSMISGLWHEFVERDAAGERRPVSDFFATVHRAAHRCFRGHQNTTVSAAVFRGEKIAISAFGAPQWMRFGAGKPLRRASTQPRNPLGIDPKPLKPNEVELEL